MTATDGKVAESLVVPMVPKQEKPAKPIQMKGAALPPNLRDTGTKERDRLLTELDYAGKSIPTWVQYLFFFLVGTAICFLPAGFIVASQSKAVYWGKEATSKFSEKIFNISVLVTLLYGINMLVLTSLAFLPYIFRHMEAWMGVRLLGARARAALKHTLMIRWSVSRLVAIFPAWILAQGYLALPDWAQQLFTALLVFAALFCLKDVVLQQVAINYHSTYYEKRITRNKLALRCMKKLRNHYLPDYRQQMGRPDSPDSLPDADDISDMQSSDNRSMASNKVEELSAILFDAIAKEVAKPELKPEDLYSVLGKSDAEAFFKYLDSDGNGDLTQIEFVLGISMVYEDRENLSKTLVQSDDVLSRLDTFVTYGVLTIGGIVCLSVFNVSGVIFGILSVQFAVFFHFFFNEMFTEAFNSIVFVFVTHPFDTGDMVLINGKTFYVRKIGLWYSSFYGQGKRLVYRRNSELCNAVIVNVHRSGAMSEEFTTTLDSKTTAKQLLALEERMSKFMRANPRDYDGITYFKNIKLANSEAITVSMEYRHRSNFADNAVKNRRNVIFLNFFRQSLEHLKIELAPYSYDLPFTPIT